MADLDKIQVNGTNYNIKDTTARNNINTANTNITNKWVSKSSGIQITDLEGFINATAVSPYFNTTQSGRFKYTSDTGNWFPGGTGWYRYIVNYQNPWEDSNTYSVGGNVLLWKDSYTELWNGVISGTKSRSVPLTVTWTRIVYEANLLQTLDAVTANSSSIKIAGANAVKTLNTNLTNLTTKVNAINVYVGSDGKIHFKNGAGTDTALNFSRGSGEAYRFIENVGYGRTDKIGGLSNIVAVSLNSSVTISVSTSLAKYMYSNADDGNCNNAVPQGAYYGKVSGYTFDKCIELTGSSFVNSVASWTVKGIKRGITIFSVVLKDSSTWYSRYLLVAVV